MNRLAYSLPAVFVLSLASSVSAATPEPAIIIASKAGDVSAVRALVARAAEEVRGGADALILLPPRAPAHRRALVRAGFAPTNKKIRFIGKKLHEGARLEEDARAWHFTLGDFDFF